MHCFAAIAVSLVKLLVGLAVKYMTCNEIKISAVIKLKGRKVKGRYPKAKVLGTRS